MPVFFPSANRLFPLLLLTTVISQVYAQQIPKSDIVTDMRAADNLNKLDVVVPDIKKNHNESLPTTLSGAESENSPIVYTPQYLQQNSEILENLLQELIRQYNADGLKLLLPIYADVPNHDPSMIDWGNAIIAMNEGRVKEAVRIYRKMIAALPEHKILRFQLAVALYRNGELTAAKDQFEKLRSIEGLNKQDIELMDKYIASIDKNNSWSFQGSLSYLDNQNLNNAPKAGTRVKIGNSVLTNTQGPKSGQGFSYSLGASKDWVLSDSAYVTFSADINGEHYFNASSYDTLSLKLAPGLGYRTPRFDFEVSPFIQKQWYGGGSSGEGHMATYVNTPGIRVEGGYWISPKFKYQGALQFGRDNYAAKYEHNSGKNILFSNTLLFAHSQNRFFFGGIDANFKDAKSLDLSYDRYGIRAGWTEEWSKGISSRLNVGFAKRYYKGKDFFGIKRINDEYSASLTLWHRGLHFYGITPRFVWSYNKTDSNHPFYDYDNNKIFLDFSKTF